MPGLGGAAERTTVATNVALALLVFGGVTALVRTAPASVLRRVWIAAFSILGAAALAGGAVHAARIDGVHVGGYWRPSYFVIACAFALIFVAAIGALWGERGARRAFAPALVSAALYFAATWRMTNDEVVLAAYGSLMIGFALVVFIRLAVLRREPGAVPVACGLGLLFVGAASQMGMTGAVHLIWTFDHNGVAHLIAALAIVPMTVGVRAMLRATPLMAAEAEVSSAVRRPDFSDAASVPGQRSAKS